MRQIVLLSLLLILFGSNGRTQAVEIDMGMVEHDKMHVYNFKNESYGEYVQSINDSLKVWLSDTSFVYPVVFSVRFSPEHSPELNFLSHENDDIRGYLSRKWDTFEDMRSLYLPQELIVIIQDSTEKQVQPNAIMGWKLKRKSTETQKWNEREYDANYLELIHWTINALQLLDVYELRKAKDLFGSSLSEDPVKLREMFKGDPQLFPIKRMFELVKNGKLEYARLYMEQIFQFESSGSFLHFMVTELHWRLLVLKIQEIKASRTKDFESIKKVHGNNHTLLWYRLDTINPPTSNTYETPKLLVLYNSNFPLSKKHLAPYSKASAYRSALREELENLFIDAESFEDDFIRFGEIAIILEDYAFATDYFWMLLNDSNRSNKYADAFFYYEYSLYKQDLLLGLSKKEEKRFKKRNKQFKKEMKRSAAYRNY